MADATRDLWGTTQEQAIHFFTRDSNSLKLSSRMHLLTLLLQELEAPCISVLQDNDFINMALALVSSCLPGLRLAGTPGTPQYVDSDDVIAFLVQLAIGK